MLDTNKEFDRKLKDKIKKESESKIDKNKRKVSEFDRKNKTKVSEFDRKSKISKNIPVSEKYIGLSTAYSIFNILQYVNPALIMIFTFITAAPYWELANSYRGGDGAMLAWFGIILGGSFLAFLSWLFTVIYKDVILLFVQMGKDISEIKNKK